MSGTSLQHTDADVFRAVCTCHAQIERHCWRSILSVIELGTIDVSSSTGWTGTIWMLRSAEYNACHKVAIVKETRSRIEHLKNSRCISIWQMVMRFIGKTGTKCE